MAVVIGTRQGLVIPRSFVRVGRQGKSGGFLLCPNGSHLAIWDDQRTYATGLVRFLKAVDAGQSTVTF